ncbi:hypothetical protein KIW84_051659 [Lathyrus oleraceus]|uniref:Helitron helicase-like domain-containing protein n=1 Tax=Pisum sativum TaxID=3888 RepID=A0A9D4WMZ2_PEA|nr:hypothetical protein KIW84_051659 [Pisum sativum]
MSVEQSQQELARRRSSYRQNKDKGKQVQTCDLSDMRTMIPFQDLTNVNLASRFYQRAYDSEVGPSTTYVSRVPSAELFHRESQDMCCKGGKVTISQVLAPDDILQLFLDNSTEDRHFRQYIRSYNHVMSFTPLGVHVDESLVATGRGIYTFRAQGVIYHKIGGFHPNQDSRSHYLQLYIYDNDHELQNRMRENPILNQVVILPSASQVAVIVISDGDEDTMERGRDINVINYDGKLTKFQETMGYYDPLQYPILLPFGTYGWDIETKTNVGKNVTCREYYSYVLRLKDDVTNKGVLGRVESYMYVAEFQKRGLPHVHMLRILDNDDKLWETEECDYVVKAEIP